MGTPLKFKKILVANRGEIAIRVFRAATELGIGTVAVYTYEDRFSMHRLKADEAYQIGEDDDPLKPYLNIDEVLRVAKKCGADAIHPGYGFLSENVEFAKRCAKAGITFVGPRPQVMEALGDKIRAKQVAEKAGVPMIPGSSDFDSVEQVAEWGAKIGYPVILKAASGGGGRGMRVCRTEAELLKNYPEAQKEAGNAFGDDTVFLEKFIENPKHIEVQLLGDNNGKIVHLFERDCSVQRRFQKVVEIAPSLDLRKETCQKLYDYALKIGRSVRYNNAGTVEFLLDAEENIYFIEVNPRVQVEHTVTEEVTGIDIVRSQILIAEGYSLKDVKLRIGHQKDVVCHGFAIQCRITTERPAENFQPDYGTIIAYRSPAGFGIRLDGGNAYAGSQISPYFDSMLVKVTSWGRTFEGACERLFRSLLEFRVRGVDTNIGFLENLILNKDFRAGKATVNFIAEHPELLVMPVRKDRGTKILRYLGETIVNGNADVPFIDPIIKLRKPPVPVVAKQPTTSGWLPGTKQKLDKLGPEGLAKWLKNQRPIHFTDTTFRDAHQSLLATRVRTYDMMQVAEKFAQAHGHQLFSMEVWGGATFDVSLRFLHECPWRRLELLREAIPNTLLQMLLRGTNAVGYTAYPNNLVEKFIEQAANTGIDIFRIFDSLNYIPSMLTSINAVKERTGSIAEACICYTSDIFDENRPKYHLSYYLDMARRLEDAGAHILAIKDMAGLLKPIAARTLVSELRKHVQIPIHLHTHDTAGIQSATYMSAIEAGVDVVDVALASMSGLTSQPNFNSLVSALEGHRRENKLDLDGLNDFSNYWEAVREIYYPFESELKAGTAEVYNHEIPGGQYTNLRPQARSLGLEHKFEQIKENYQKANLLLGDIVKVTPSSKVVGDLAMFMTSNDLSPADVLERGESLAFPDSVKSLLRGELGKVEGGFPPRMVEVVLKGEQPMEGAANSHLLPVDFEGEMKVFSEKFGENYTLNDFLSYKLYPKVYEKYHSYVEEFGDLSKLPSQVFFFGLRPNEEILIEIAEGKTLLITFMNITVPDIQGNRLAFFRYNGTTRTVKVRDKNVKSELVLNKKAEREKEVGAPLQGSLGSILVKEGDVVKQHQPLFTIEAMKMESTVAAPMAGTVKKIFLPVKTLVLQGDAVIELA
ncbi:MAG: pyruvate carboxylase [Saprospiraceae bacterium]|nr:pyruvate carboxylase [Saprospiraceae bacterium]MCF8248483.1 pyruvate carboxylase [Saprospiraceae bacterium]MCF8281816.1 pyruvate carboxylase [Bacteroidales bacterium]MCF8310217.1 pyruvate carboxylase [Saprospiraceae bacterium]MCF8439344.1 pyruvate carboxylase [Saprospiraceae bacterium]